MMLHLQPFKPAWWLPGAHAQTIWPSLFSRKYDLDPRRERFELSDGDFIDLDWIGADKGPIILILHGLGGSMDSHYVRRMLRMLKQQGLRAVVMHFRGCSGEPNRKLRSYHSGETGDLAEVLTYLKRKDPEESIITVAYSLGANVVLKYLGEMRDRALINAVIAVSVPFDLSAAAKRMSQGVSRIYQRYLLNKLKAEIRAKQQRFKQFAWPSLEPLKTFELFDNEITAPIHGFKDADHYYRISSSRQYLRFIERKTLIIHAQDDPFMTPDVVPTENELSPYIDLEVSQSGGHVGFVSGRIPFKPQYWLESRCMAFIQQQLWSELAYQVC